MTGTNPSILNGANAAGIGRHAFALQTGFASRYVLKGGFLDGAAGYTWALLAGMHSYCKYAKLAELERTSGGGVG